MIKMLGYDEYPGTKHLCAGSTTHNGGDNYRESLIFQENGLNSYGASVRRYIRILLLGEQVAGEVNGSN